MVSGRAGERLGWQFGTGQGGHEAGTRREEVGDAERQDDLRDTEAQKTDTGRTPARTGLRETGWQETGARETWTTTNDDGLRRDADQARDAPRTRVA